MFERNVKIRNELGLHARPAQLLVQTADQFRSEIFLSNDGVEVNGKSIMGVMMLAAAQGSMLVIRADGSDEREAVAQLVALIESKFGED